MCSQDTSQNKNNIKKITCELTPDSPIYVIDGNGVKTKTKYKLRNIREALLDFSPSFREAMKVLSQKQKQSAGILFLWLMFWL